MLNKRPRRRRRPRRLLVDADDEAMLCMRTRTQPAMSKGCDAHCVFDNLRPSKARRRAP